MKTERKAILPKRLVNAIKEQRLNKPKWGKVIHFLKLLYMRSLRSGGTFEEFTELSANYLVKVFNSHYFTDVVEPLIKWGIIEVDGSYSDGSRTKDKWCKSYRIAPVYLKGKPIIATYLRKEYDQEESQDHLTESVRNSMKMLNFDYDRAINNLDALTDETLRENYVPVSEIQRTRMWVHLDGGMKQNMGIDHAKDYASGLGKELFGYKNKFFIGDPNEFLERKREAVKSNLETHAFILNKKFFWASRNQTNNRLDSTLSCLPKRLLKYLTLEGEKLIQIDFKNSQFAILGYLLNAYRDSEILRHFSNDYDFADLLDPVSANEDVVRFGQIVKEGFYEYVARELHLSGREDAKALMFQVLFSKRNFQSSEKSKLTRLFPSVMGFIDKFKEEYGNKNFSVMLQKIESKIFIDNLLQLFQKRGIMCITKHDCLIVKESDYEKAERTISTYFRSIKLYGTFSIGDGRSFQVRSVEINAKPKVEIVQTVLAPMGQMQEEFDFSCGQEQEYEINNQIEPEFWDGFFESDDNPPIEIDNE